MSLRYNLCPVYKAGRATSDQLAKFARYTYNAHGSDYLLVKDNSSLQIDRYLAVYDSNGLTGKTRAAISTLISELPIGTVVEHVDIGYGFRNTKYQSFRFWKKVTQDDWVLQD